MDFTPTEIEQMAAGLREFAAEPPVTPEEEEDALLTQVRKIIRTSDGEPDQFQVRYVAEGLEMIYGGRVFARCGKDASDGEWVEFRMYPALRRKYDPDERFTGVEDKDAEYWRVNLARPQDIDAYSDLINDETV